MCELKPCPFCGGKPRVQEHRYVGYASTFGVVCLDCCCETRPFFDTEEEAIKAWNRRVENEVKRRM